MSPSAFPSIENLRSATDLVQDRGLSGSNLMVTLDQAGRRHMQIRLIQPDRALAHVVEHQWLDEHDDGHAVHSEEHERSVPDWRIVPDTSPHLIWHVRWLRHRLVGRLHLVGARRRYCDIDVASRVLTVGTRLCPGSLPVLFGLPADALTDRVVCLSDLLPTTTLEQQLWDARPHAAAALLGRFLRHRRARARPATTHVETLVASLAGASDAPVASTAALLGLSPRRVLQLARRHLGMTGMEFVRIARMHRAMLVGLSPPRARWSAAASAAGYADQSHFVRECRALLGETPGSFLARRRVG